MCLALVAFIVVASRVSYLLLRCVPPHGFFWLVFAFSSIRSFHAVRSSPVSTSSLAAARRICVCPIFPPPPGIGRKISGAPPQNAASCSSVSTRFPYPPACEASEANFLPPTRKAGNPAWEYSSTPSRLQCNPAKVCCGHRVTPCYGVSDHHRTAYATAPGRITGKLSVKALRKRLSGRVGRPFTNWLACVSRMFIDAEPQAYFLDQNHESSQHNVYCSSIAGVDRRS
jgi:hypothetical protein